MSRRGKGERCTYCDRVLEATGSRTRLEATRDHVVPKSRGGDRTVWACRLCNAIKGDMLPDEWAAFMADYPRWWLLTQFRAITRFRRNLPRAVSNLDRPGEALERLRQRDIERASKRRSTDDDPRWATGYYTPVSPDDPVPGPHATRWPPLQQQ